MQVEGRLIGKTMMGDNKYCIFQISFGAIATSFPVYEQEDIDSFQVGDRIVVSAFKQEGKCGAIVSKDCLTNQV